MASTDFNNRPYILHFQSRLIFIEKSTDIYPTWCKYQMKSAQKVILYHFRKTEILTQTYIHSPFFIELVQIRTGIPFQFKFQVIGDQLFFLFMLNGAIEFSTDAGQYITRARTNCFYLSHNSPGTFKAKLNKGNNIAFVVSIKIDWAKVVCQDFKNLLPLFRNIFESNNVYNLLPLCHMDKQVHLWLKEMYLMPRGNIGILEGKLRLYISLVLEHYDELLAKRDESLAYKLKRYLDEHYFDPEIGYQSLADIFCTTKRTLRNQFKMEFGITIFDYYSQLRLKTAKYLIENEKIAVKDVCFRVGFKDVSTFRYAYNKYTEKKDRKI